MEQQETNNKWDERHFQICLALMSRPTLPNEVSPSMRTIIKKADKMISLLKERETNPTKYENIP